MNESQLNILASKIAKRLLVQPRWLKLSSAAKYAGMNPKRLKFLAQNGDIIGYRDADTIRQDWIFDKKSIDQYRLKPVQEFQIKAHKILDDMKGFI